MADNSVLKTYVRPDNTAVLTCPNCGFQKTIDTRSFKEHKSKVKVKCTCGTIFTTIIEFRQRIRKRTHLRGTYVNHSQNDKKGNLTVTDVSVSGLQFTCMDVESFKIEDELTIVFTLDDELRSEVRQQAIVRGIRPRSVGCEFPGAGEYAFEGPLGFYIRS
jgi:PilZ domain